MPGRTKRIDFEGSKAGRQNVDVVGVKQIASDDQCILFSSITFEQAGRNFLSNCRTVRVSAIPVYCYSDVGGGSSGNVEQQRTGSCYSVSDKFLNLLKVSPL